MAIILRLTKGAALTHEELDGNFNHLDTNKIETSAKGAVNGVASLDGSGKVPESQLPAIAITDTNVVGSQAAMLALTAQKGDVAVRIDLNKTFVLSTNSPTTLVDWIELKTPTDLVQSVAGKTGTVTLVKADVGLGSVDNTSDADKPVSTAQGIAIAAKLSPNMAGNVISNFATLFSVVTVNTTIVVGDTGSLILMNNASARTFTLNDTVPINTCVTLGSIGTGDVTLVAGGTAVLLEADAQYKIGGRYMTVVCLKISSTDWLLIGRTKA